MIICLGINNDKIIESFKEMVPNIVESIDMLESVSIAFKNSNQGETILLSPACASFDLFKNYEDRGNQFKSAFEILKKHSQDPQKDI